MYSICSICSSPGIFTSQLPRHRTAPGNGAARLVKPCFGSLTISAARNGTSLLMILVCISNILHMYVYVCLYIYHENNEWHVIYCKIIWMYKCISVMCVCASKRLWFIVSFRCSMIERDKAWENTHTQNTGHNTGCKLIHGFHGWKNRCLQGRLLVSSRLMRSWSS